MRVHVEGEGPLELGDDALVAVGGEGALYARGEVAYKVYAQAAPTASRLRALAALRVPRAALPDRLLTSEEGRPVGFTMRFLRDHVPYARLCTRAFRDRNSLDTPRALALVRRLRDALAAVHAQGGAVVDLNELNVLVDPGLSDPWLVDTASWQLPGHPATAVMDHVRDRHARPGVFDARTDRFALAVLAFHLLVGVHPYRGLHPDLPDLDARMRAQVTVLHREVRVPPGACFPFDALPLRWQDWLVGVLERGRRDPPPDGEHDAVPVRPVSAPAATALRVEVLLRADGPVLAAAVWGQRVAAVTGRSLLVDGRVALTAAGLVAVAFSPTGAPVAVARADRTLSLLDGRTGSPVPCTLAVDALTVVGGRIVVRTGDRLVELVLHDVRGQVVAAPQVLATVHPAATTLHEGLVVERIRGCTFLGRPEGTGWRRLRVPELDGVRIVDARSDGPVALLSIVCHGEPTVAVVRIGAGAHDLRLAPAAVPSVELAVLSSGVAVRLADGRLELFRTRVGDAEVRTVEEPPPAGIRLLSLGGRLGGVVDGSLLALSLA